jgi:hypothetical protein
LFTSTVTEVKKDHHHSRYSFFSGNFTFLGHFRVHQRSNSAS